MKLEDTRIQIGGVMRCCHASVAEEYRDTGVELGATSKCPHCGTTFTLRHHDEPCPEWLDAENWARPLWMPDWDWKRKHE